MTMVGSYRRYLQSPSRRKIVVAIDQGRLGAMNGIAYRID